MSAADFDSLVGLLEVAAERAEAAIRSVPPGRWDEVIHTGDGAWTRRQLLSHLAANDLRQLIRIRIGAGIQEPGDADAHAAELDTMTWNRDRVAEREGRDVEALITEMRANRRAVAELLRSLTPEQRERPIPYRGVPTPIPEAVPTLIGHYDAHIQELLAGL